MPGDKGIGSRVEAFLDELREIEAARLHDAHGWYKGDEGSKLKTNAVAPTLGLGAMAKTVAPAMKSMKPIGALPPLAAVKPVSAPTPKGPTAPSVPAVKGAMKVQ